MANGTESEKYVAQARPVLLSGTGTPPLRNMVTSATYLQHNASVTGRGAAPPPRPTPRCGSSPPRCAVSLRLAPPPPRRIHPARTRPRLLPRLRHLRSYSLDRRAPHRCPIPIAHVRSIPPIREGGTHRMPTSIVTSRKFFLCIRIKYLALARRLECGSTEKGEKRDVGRFSCIHAATLRVPSAPPSGLISLEWRHPRLRLLPGTVV